MDRHAAAVVVNIVRKGIESFEALDPRSGGGGQPRGRSSGLGL